MTRPTLYLTNWGSRKMHGPGRKLCAMAAPRRWEKGDGYVPVALPDLTALRRVQSDGDLMAYRRDCEERWTALARIARFDVHQRPSRGLRFIGPDANGRKADQSVRDGDTLLCACARPGSPKRTHPCHLELLTPYLVRAGWDVVLHGRWLSIASERIGDPEVCPDDAVIDIGGEVVTPEDYGWPAVTP